VWFILEFSKTQILISTTSRFECISRLIKVTDIDGVSELQNDISQNMTNV
jgi:hypothetical protein